MINRIKPKIKVSILLLILIGLQPVSVFGQVGEFFEDIPGFGIWLVQGDLTFGDASPTAKDEIKGYTAVLQKSPARGQGISITVNKGTFGISYSRDEGAIEINEDADIQQTPNNLTDDVFVHSMSRVNRSTGLVVIPFPFFMISIGEDTGEMKIVQSSGGDKETIQIPYSNLYWSFAFTFGLDPPKDTNQFVLSAFYKSNFEGADFGGSILALAIGFYFGD